MAPLRRASSVRTAARSSHDRHCVGITVIALIVELHLLGGAPHPAAILTYASHAMSWLPILHEPATTKNGMVHD